MLFPGSGTSGEARYLDAQKYKEAGYNVVLVTQGGTSANGIGENSAVVVAQDTTVVFSVEDKDGNHTIERFTGKDVMSIKDAREQGLQIEGLPKNMNNTELKPIGTTTVSEETILQDNRAILDFLKDAGEIYLDGYSLGGACALSMASLDPEATRIKGVILDRPFTNPHEAAAHHFQRDKGKIERAIVNILLTGTVKNLYRALFPRNKFVIGLKNLQGDPVRTTGFDNQAVLREYKGKVFIIGAEKDEHVGNFPEELYERSNKQENAHIKFTQMQGKDHLDAVDDNTRSQIIQFIGNTPTVSE